MPNILESSAAWLGAQLQAAAGTDVVYTQGATAVPLTAMRATSSYSVVDEKGIVVTTVVSIDWTILTEDLAGLTPRKGDTITADGETYQVMAIGDKQPYEPLGNSTDALLVVHSKRI